MEEQKVLSPEGAEVQVKRILTALTNAVEGLMDASVVTIVQKDKEIAELKAKLSEQE
ncbi:MAG: hypothetical protein JSW00_06195 [Thermoplasmata archaeon]|nr:MAG: hypothetical protein JSW00_06195 [Thermoplasmata archaeon]